VPSCNRRHIADPENCHRATTLPNARAQGKLAANCWLLSAISCLTEYQDALPVLFADRGRPLQELSKVCARALHARNVRAPARSAVCLR
jgi:hypothetical protein